MFRTAVIAMSLSLAACGESAIESVADPSCSRRAYEEIGGPISLIDHTGALVTEEAYKGVPSLVFFGFTYCPDVCPMTLVTIEKALAQLPDSINAPRTILISVDPERDTPETLAAYISTAAFPDDIVGLTGEPERIREAADAFLADYARVEQDESLAEFTMDHTTMIYLMDEDWTLKSFFTHSDTPESIAACLAELL